MTPPTTDEPKKLCNRNYSEGAHTVRVRNGIAICVSCGFPTKEHKK